MQLVIQAIALGTPYAQLGHGLLQRRHILAFVFVITLFNIVEGQLYLLVFTFYLTQLIVGGQALLFVGFFLLLQFALPLTQLLLQIGPLAFQLTSIVLQQGL